ncbi:MULTISPECIES: hypothetical protein [Xenorhabdus]|uniref:hypothetical protein n=1 Tax=Xenorhabdus TaxID=626 RepID=UPI001E62A35A|nr:MULTISPECIES: hypothetical protein [Xenorhabdus]
MFFSVTLINASLSHNTGRVTRVLISRQNGDMREVLVISPASSTTLAKALLISASVVGIPLSRNTFS